MVRLVQCIAFIFILHTAFALECYTCSGHSGLINSGNACEEFNFYEIHKKSLCMPGEVCAKTVVNHDGMTWVHRSCKPYDICNYLSGVYRNGRDQLLECATCADANLCNSKLLYVSSFFLTSLCLILSKIF